MPTLRLRRHPPRFWTGWRISEVLNLEWRNINHAKLLHTKTAEEEYRALPNEALTILSKIRHLNESPYVFPGSPPPTHHLTTVRGPWQHIRRRAGLDNLDGLGPLRLHDLRQNSSAGT